MKEIYRSKNTGLSLLILVLVFVIIGTRTDRVTASKKSCAMFTSQYDAQAVYDSDPGKYRILDADKDGVACESLIKINR